MTTHVVYKIASLPTPLSSCPPALLLRTSKPLVLVGLFSFYWKLGPENRARKHVFSHLCCSACCFIYEAGILHLPSRPSHSWCLNIMRPSSLLEEYVLFPYCSWFLHFLLPEWKSSDYLSQFVLQGHISASFPSKQSQICCTVSSLPTPWGQWNLCKGVNFHMNAVWRHWQQGHKGWVRRPAAALGWSEPDPASSNGLPRQSLRSLCQSIAFLTGTVAVGSPRWSRGRCERDGAAERNC